MALSVQGLNKSFRDKLTLKQTQVLHNVSFEVKTGSVVGFLGNNGAGKTTTMKCVLQLLRPDSGEVKVFGKTGIEARKHVGYLPERPYFYDYLTAMEFLLFYGQLSTASNKKTLKKRSGELLELVGLSAATHKQLRTFSKGMLQRVGLAQALIHEPDFLILDEPMAGLDPDGRHKMAQVISFVKDQGATIMLSSHLLDDVEKICDTLVVIDQGRITYQGGMKDLLQVNTTGYEVTYRKENQVEKKMVQTMGELQSFIQQIENEKGRLLQVQEPFVTLEEAFANLKEHS